MSNQPNGTTRSCIVCGKRFTSRRKRQVMCSPICRTERNNARYGPKEIKEPSKLEPRVCATCEREYIPIRQNQRYCSVPCRTIGYGPNDRGAFVIYQRDSFRCVYCGRSSIEHSAVLHCDHIHPRIKGGEDIAGNLVTACSNCNLSKATCKLTPSVLSRIFALISQRNEAAGLADGLIIKLPANEAVQGSKGPFCAI